MAGTPRLCLSITCDNSQLCPGLHHPALCDLDVGLTVGFRSFIQQPTRPGGPGWAGLLRSECPWHPEQLSDALTHHHPGRSPLGLDGAEAVREQTRGASPPAVGWVGREDLADSGGCDSRSIFKEHVWIFTTLPGFIGVTPRADPFPIYAPENRLRSAKRFISTTKPEVSEQADRRPPELCSRLPPCSTCPNRRDP